MIKAVLLDLDGTLLDTVPDLAAAANAIVGLADEWREVDCTDVRELIERLRAGHEFRLLERVPSHR